MKSEAEWKKELPPEVHRVMRLKGTERPYSGEYYLHNLKGIYNCRACGLPLFSSESKFHCACGWPSFYEQLKEECIQTEEDRSHGMIRTEVHCSQCGGHLGHLFDDGPPPTGKRYCINSVAITFSPKREKDGSDA